MSRVLLSVRMEKFMPRTVTDSRRVELRLRPEDKTTLIRAEADIADAEHLTLSDRDSLRVLDLLEHPPAASKRLVRAARAGFTVCV